VYNARLANKGEHTREIRRLLNSLEATTRANGDELGVVCKETGHPARPGLTYGMTVSLKNVYQEFMQSDANGWVYLRASNGKWDHFDILSPLHREGPVSYGDQVLLRAHNTKLVSVRPGGGLEAVKQTPDLSCVFTLVGKSGIVHNDASVAFRSAAGYINAAAGAQRAQIDGSGHYQANFNFVISSSLKHKVNFVFERGSLKKNKKEVEK
jgi:hypothetical protein